MAATLDLDEHVAEGFPLPLLWQWAYFFEWPKTAELGDDGHPSDGHFLPPIPNRRRMFAGARIEVDTPLVIGRDVTRQSDLVGLDVKRGRTGELLFVTVRHVYLQRGAVCVLEEQDLVYRSAVASSTAARITEPHIPSTAPWSVTRKASAPLLFRFSAVTGNSHRIHYDEAYTTGVEGFPALVVHGPLLAMYMAQLVRDRTAGQPIRGFDFRLQRPAFVGDVLSVEGRPRGSSIELSVGSGASTVHATAMAKLA